MKWMYTLWDKSRICSKHYDPLPSVGVFGSYEYVDGPDPWKALSHSEQEKGLS